MIGTCGGENSTYSVLDLNNIHELTEKISGLANAFLANKQLYNSISDQMLNSQSFYDEGISRDLYKFVTLIKGMNGVTPDIFQVAEQLLSVFSNTILYNGAQSEYAGANGISIYTPDYGGYIDEMYLDSGAVWNQRSTWDDFLIDFINTSGIY